jgi:hypothetical protein
MPGWWKNWIARHRHPASQVLHAIGIPLLPVAGILIVWQLAENRWDLWYRPVMLFVVSYLLQWIGHRIEGNDMGELILFKRLLGRRYTAISPRFRTDDSDDDRVANAYDQRGERTSDAVRES